MRKPTVFYKLNKHGGIASTLLMTVEEGEVPDGYSKSASSGKEIIALKNPEKYVYKNKKFQLKPTVSFQRDSNRVLKADGKDFVTVWLDDPPSNVKTVNVSVGGVVQEISATSEFEVSTDTPQTIVVRLVRSPVLCEPLFIEARDI